MNHWGEHKNISSFFTRGFCLFSFGALLITACSFDYGAVSESDKNKPDIVMENLEYVRVRGGDPLVRFQAEYAERWEDRQAMELRNFSFEQLQDHGETINAQGRAGAASVQLNSGNISLKNGVSISVESEDITIQTSGLEWRDKEKTLSGAANAEVDIERSDGTSFSGIGFSADARNRTWTFTGEVKGSYVEKDDGKSGGEAGETAAETASEVKTPAQPVQVLTPPAEKVLPVTEPPKQALPKVQPAEEK